MSRGQNNGSSWKWIVWNYFYQSEKSSQSTNGPAFVCGDLYCYLSLDGDYSFRIRLLISISTLLFLFSSLLSYFPLSPPFPFRKSIPSSVYCFILYSRTPVLQSSTFCPAYGCLLQSLRWFSMFQDQWIIPPSLSSIFPNQRKAWRRL